MFHFFHYHGTGPIYINYQCIIYCDSSCTSANPLHHINEKLLTELCAWYGSSFLLDFYISRSRISMLFMIPRPSQSGCAVGCTSSVINIFTLYISFTASLILHFEFFNEMSILSPIKIDSKIEPFNPLSISHTVHYSTRYSVTNTCTAIT